MAEFHCLFICISQYAFAVCLMKKFLQWVCVRCLCLYLLRQIERVFWESMIFNWVSYAGEWTMNISSLHCISRAADSWSKCCKIESQYEWWKNLLLQSYSVLTLTQCTCHSCVTAVARKRSCLLCQKCRWQIVAYKKHSYILDPTKVELADYASRHSVGTY